MSTTPLPHTPSLFSLRSQGETTPSLPAGFRNMRMSNWRTFPQFFGVKVKNIWQHQVVILMVAQHWWFQRCSNWKMDGPTLRCYQGTPPKTKSSPLKIHGWKMELLFGMVLFEEICKFLGVPKSPTFLPFSDHRIEWVTVFSQWLGKGALKRGLYGQSYTWRAVSLKETTRWFQLIPPKNTFFHRAGAT